MRLGLSGVEQREIVAAFDERQEEARQQWLRYFMQQGDLGKAADLAISADEVAWVKGGAPPRALFAVRR